MEHKHFHYTLHLPASQKQDSRCLADVSISKQKGQADAYHSYHFDFVDTVSQPFRVRIRVNRAKCCVSSRTIKTELKSRTATSKYEMTWKWMRRRVMAMATTTIRQEGGISRQVWAWARYGDWAWAWVRVSVSGYAWICMLRFNIYRWFV